MNDALEVLRNKAIPEIASAKSEPELQQIKARFLGRKGELTALLKELGALPPEQRREAGARLNQVKDELEALLQQQASVLHEQGLKRLAASRVDITLPGRPTGRGHIHPISQVLFDIEDIFLGLGFDIEDGPEVEDDFHNFEALNLPEGHPAREMQDTFYVGPLTVLRTHTSPVQIRTMERRDPPLRIIAPGAVYRSDMDMTHTPMFHQVEGLMVDDRVSMTDLKGILVEFVRRMFGPQSDIKFRASFFPFTEPSAEVDMLCHVCHGSGCRTCKHTGWIEIGGCGMVNPAVFRKVGRPEYDPSRIRGFAFGMGIERIAMLKYGFTDIRQLFENDVRLLQQF